MRQAHATLYRLLLARDPLHDGAFFTGVLTTGIYCLPSCRARKPLPQNVRFFPSCTDARAAGLRACLKCHPDDYEAGADPVLATIEGVVAEVRGDPARFPDAESVVRRSGYGTTRAFELFRQHYQTTPADLLADARVRRACALLHGDGGSLTDLALACGFASQSAFHAAFRARVGMTPNAYRALRRAGAALRLHLPLPPDFDRDAWARSAGRDATSPAERLETPHRLVAAVRLQGGAPARLEIDVAKPGRASVCIQKIDTKGAALTSGESADALLRIRALLGLGHDTAGFLRLVAKLRLGRLVAGHEALRPVRHWSAWDALVWAILGQQINLAFTMRLRGNLFRLAGEDIGDGLCAPPTPQAVAALSPAALAKAQFSRQKIATLLRVARAVSDGSLPLGSLEHGSATRTARALRSIPGLGPWTVNYVLLRGLGWPDCVPYRDTGVMGGLQRLFKLKTRPDEEETRRLMLPFSPHRSLATAHLWHFL